MGIVMQGAFREEPPCLVWPENWRAVQLFLAMGTQWNWVAISGFGGGSVFRVGLKLEVLPVVAGAHDIRITADLLAALSILEAEYIELTK
ncbi:DUF1799 domain-containing protein [Niveispirillum sp. KHB5.9]|uniref:DUF1799 domain-containing protein n=1 Tax=Niveispirillum sp. KHB5.9 TaxID=3400269 RepID=UPI003A83DA2F